MNHPADLETAPSAMGSDTAIPISRAIWAASIGTAFEWYEFALYGSLATVLAAKFFSGVEAGTAFIFALLTFAVGFMMRPLGALVFGRIGDMIGRKRTFVVTICMMGVATVGVGCLPTYASIGITAPIVLICLRILQGLAAGGEYAGALTYVAEYSTSRRRGLNMSWTTAATTAGLLLSFLVILAARELSGDGFDVWGWRLPFIGSIIMLAISLAMRLRMEESPAFRKLLQNKQLSKSPIRETFLDAANFRRLAVAFGLCAGMTSMYYMAALYPTFFLTQTLKVDPKTVNTVVLLATAVCLPMFPISGWLCDRIGRKPALLIGFATTAVLLFPVFHGFEHFANPALASAQAAAPITVETDASRCSLLFNPLGNRRFTSSCDMAKQALAAAGVSYSVEDKGSAATTTVIRVGNGTLTGYSAAGLTAPAAKAQATHFAGELRELLTAQGYPAHSDPAAFNGPMVFVLLVVFFSCSIITVMTIGPALVEMFPTRIRYTSMSVPYNAATGWVGGLLPTFVFAISAQTGNIFSGLWYPLGWTIVSLIALILFFRETRDVNIND
ncbi:MFS transporter [Burkholderia multivorans]|uniref:MFS transporter n=1 Tax=Burkholderia multivorans TaxID=87883 RepID=UPI00201177E4|nr:MFS transporter [Burkholderia multivorans]MDR9175098.1 Proline/betaine transporter [Burkholderia multivorans]MDR9182449.1 Proline/betaine transporter [Burkholderia multivorans]MDR9187934.1 Proline/betaine transporter [Burkholderia multivorans]MDR9193397.1 Proline/betaine transporter [Burkholderia multivorans]MDR9199153.1 Proline/betaine transporter [Burkholderia multivorans]